MKLNKQLSVYCFCVNKELKLKKPLNNDCLLYEVRPEGKETFNLGHVIQGCTTRLQ